MCGIIGYTGRNQAIPKMTEGLRVLEYRGYDSVGIAAREKEQIRVLKCKGRIGDLCQKEELKEIRSECAIGHTRWATHGGPSDVNAHPHRVGDTVLVHNGIVENYKELKEELEGLGVEFRSQTDTEVAAALINTCYQRTKEPLAAIRAAVERLRGSFAFGILFENRPSEVWAVRSGSPLILAKGEDGSYLASDLTALLPFTRFYFSMTEGQIARLTERDVCVYPTVGESFEPEWKESTLTPEAAQKGGFAHFMKKEIFEQSEAIVKSVSSRIQNGLPDFSADGIHPDFWKSVKNLQIVACGSAMHAGLMGAHFLEEIAQVPTSVHIASEYRYHPPLAVPGTVVIIISQSGETADSLAALRYAKSVGLPTLAIVNAVETTIAREADRRIYTFAGPEIAVATTKGYCTQVSVLYLIATAIAHVCGRATEIKIRDAVLGVLQDAPRAIEHMLSNDHQALYRRIAARLAKAKHLFYIGRGASYALSMEGALKLKEISYIHAEAYAAGELKHGTISLIENGTPVIAISTEKTLFDKTESNVREVESRGACVIRISRDDTPDADRSEDVILLPTDSEVSTVFAAMTAIQMLAYETADCLGCDIDRPRNLAKSVTVE